MRTSVTVTSAAVLALLSAGGADGGHTAYTDRAVPGAPSLSHAHDLDDAMFDAVMGPSAGAGTLLLGPAAGLVPAELASHFADRAHPDATSYAALLSDWGTGLPAAPPGGSATSGAAPAGPSGADVTDAVLGFPAVPYPGFWGFVDDAACSSVRGPEAGGTSPPK